MNSYLNMERQRKKNIIVDSYDNRTHTQQDIVKKYSIPIWAVRKVLKANNYEYTTKNTPENLKNGRKIIMCIELDYWSFLDKYDF